MKKNNSNTIFHLPEKIINELSEEGYREMSDDSMGEEQRKLPIAEGMY